MGGHGGHGGHGGGHHGGGGHHWHGSQGALLIDDGDDSLDLLDLSLADDYDTDEMGRLAMSLGVVPMGRRFARFSRMPATIIGDEQDTPDPDSGDSGEGTTGYTDPTAAGGSQDDSWTDASLDDGSGGGYVDTAQSSDMAYIGQALTAMSDAGPGEGGSNTSGNYDPGDATSYLAAPSDDGGGSYDAGGGSGGGYVDSDDSGGYAQAAAPSDDGGYAQDDGGYAPDDGSQDDGSQDDGGDQVDDGGGDGGDDGDGDNGGDSGGAGQSQGGGSSGGGGDQGQQQDQNQDQGRHKHKYSRAQRAAWRADKANMAAAAAIAAAAPNSPFLAADVTGHRTQTSQALLGFRVPAAAGSPTAAGAAPVSSMQSAIMSGLNAAAAAAGGASGGVLAQHLAGNQTQASQALLSSFRVPMPAAASDPALGGSMLATTPGPAPVPGFGQRPGGPPSFTYTGAAYPGAPGFGRSSGPPPAGSGITTDASTGHSAASLGLGNQPGQGGLPPGVGFKRLGGGAATASKPSGGTAHASALRHAAARPAPKPAPRKVTVKRAPARMHGEFGDDRGTIDIGDDMGTMDDGWPLGGLDDITGNAYVGPMEMSTFSDDEACTTNLDPTVAWENPLMADPREDLQYPEGYASTSAVFPGDLDPLEYADYPCHTSDEWDYDAIAGQPAMMIAGEGDSDVDSNPWAQPECCDVDNAGYFFNPRIGCDEVAGEFDADVGHQMRLKG